MKYYIAEAIHTQTGKRRIMSFPAKHKLFVFDLDNTTAPAMLEQFVIERRPAGDLMTKHHFANWIASYLHNPNNEYEAYVELVDKKTFRKFNKLVDKGRSLFNNDKFEFVEETV